mmetsp:Transcript_29023/g.72942  ORF Transcript_29023/g.72942 Transcript_29023/m.72942 type:complete len:209 (-) Transcript_29023:530-1156(-)
MRICSRRTTLRRRMRRRTRRRTKKNTKRMWISCLLGANALTILKIEPFPINFEMPAKRKLSGSSTWSTNRRKQPNPVGDDVPHHVLFVFVQPTFCSSANRRAVWPTTGSTCSHRILPQQSSTAIRRVVVEISPNYPIKMLFSHHSTRLLAFRPPPPPPPLRHLLRTTHSTQKRMTMMRRMVPRSCSPKTESANANELASIATSARCGP